MNNQRERKRTFRNDDMDGDEFGSFDLNLVKLRKYLHTAISSNTYLRKSHNDYIFFFADIFTL